MIALLAVAYLLIGEAVALGYLVAAAQYNRRFNPKPSYLHQSDMVWIAVIQLTWPITSWLLIPFAVSIWRNAVANQRCVCGHLNGVHTDGHGCTHQAYATEFIVRGEGPEFFYCECPKFTLPNVRPRR